MRLTQIKLAGFKSFVDATAIPTPSQLVGVVGPNGCGKSNIIDAVRWVLGESRASELRGESMQDVIFNGSGNRKQAARASVELIFDNALGRATGPWAAYAEISVRRVLTRDGASSYYINQQAVRRRDIHDMFLGTGLGTRGYAIIGQGMINRLIEARPEDMRVFLEEAAGVSRYKERRRETENRLQDTRENLSRVEDILRELDGQLQRLEAQAEVARQYREWQQEGEQKQQALWLLKENEAQEARARHAQATEQAQLELDRAQASLRHAETGLVQLREAHYAAGDAVHQAQGQLYEAGAQVSRLEAEIRHVVDGRQRLHARREQLQAQLQEWAEQQAHMGESLAQSQEALAEAQALIEESHAQLEQVQARQPDLEARVQAAGAGRDGMRAALARLQQDLALAAQSQRDADRQLQALAVRRERLQGELSGLQVPDAAALARAEGDHAALSEQLDEAQAQLGSLEDRLPALEDARRQAQAAAQASSQEMARLEARLAALVRLQEDVQQQGALPEWMDKHGLSAMGRLWQRLQVEPGWETAVESVLRERMLGLEVGQLSHARAFIDEPPPARLALYQLPAPHAPTVVQGGLSPLVARLRMTDPALRTLLDAWLRDVYEADDLASALAGRDRLPAGAQYVVRSGHVIDRHSVRFYAPDSEQAGMLARQQEIDNLRRELKAQHLMADQTATAAGRAERDREQAVAAQAVQRRRVSELTQRAHELQLSLNRLQQQAAQSQDTAQRLQADLAELSRNQEELVAQREEAEQRFESLDETLAGEQERYAEAEMAGEQLAAEAQGLREQVRTRERAVQEADFAERALRARIAELERNQRLAAEQHERQHSALASLQGELFELDESAAQAGLQDALSLRAEREDALQRARVTLDTLAAQLREADEGRLQLEHTLEPQRARIMQLQLDEQAARLAAEQFAEQLDAMQVDRAALAALLASQPDDWRRTGWLQAEVQRISRRIEGLGPVNLAALEELGTARERKTYLDAQHADLTTAITTLEDAIRKIDRDMRDLLQQTFDTVNGYFGELFPRLFGGGESRLVMTGEEILDAGVQVMAQPPGKRNSTIQLLSGGEKALTAIALVFAFFKLNPAPFCLLDEVDAPLDDANTERYANLVASMSDQTQFLFISHNKIAMQMAKQLIGVTMQEQGVSRIVAVDIEAALQMADA